MKTISDFIKEAPKAELHVHIEGTLEPEMVFMLARRNDIKLDFSTVKELREHYAFKNLQAFLDLYNKMICVLQTEEDFYDLTCAYLNRAQANSIRHLELFFDPQGHLRWGVPLSVVIAGITRAFDYGKTLGISCHLIMCFLRELPESEAEQTLQLALPFKDKIIAVGLASAEKGNPPEKFAAVFKKAIEHGFLTVAHAGEEGPAEYIWQALDILHVSRIDHGNACVHDPALIHRLIRDQIALTMCPLSNLRLNVIASLADHPAKFLLDKGVCVTINSDDPAYFGGYLNDNLLALTDALNLTAPDIYAFLQNGFQASFLPLESKSRLLNELEQHAKSYPELFAPSFFEI